MMISCHLKGFLKNEKFELFDDPGPAKKCDFGLFPLLHILQPNE